MARYEEVHAALVDWQGFQSAAGRRAVELPLREAVAAAEPAARGRPAAARRPPPGAAEGPRPAGAAPAARAAGSPTPRPSSTRCWRRGDRVRRRPGAGRGVPAAGVPRRRRHPAARAGRTCCPTATTVQRLRARATTWCAKGAPRVAELSAWVNAQCAARRARRRRVRRRRSGRPSDRGDITPEQAPLVVRSLLTAGVDTTVHGLSAVLYAFATNPGPVAAAARATRRWRGSPSTRRCAGSRRCRRSSAPRPPTSASATPSSPRATRSSCSSARPTATRGAGTTRTPSTSSRDPSGHVGFGMGIHQCVGQHVARLEAEALLTALARRVAHDRARRPDDAAPQQHAARVGEHPRPGAAGLTGAGASRPPTPPRRQGPPPIGSGP